MSHLEKDRKICAIVVTYHPDLDTLRRLLDVTRPQADSIVVVDNGSNADTLNWLYAQGHEKGIVLLALGENLGIATGHNRGIEWAKKQGYTHVLLLDQDSIPAADMVERLVAVSERLREKGVPVAAVGPQFKDERYPHPAPFIRLDGWRISKISGCDDNDTGYVQADYLVSSGMLIDMPALDVIGLMDEGLFIDYVDIEWGLRAKSKGFCCFGVCSATLRHNLGDGAVRFFGKRVPVHSPLRHYYHFRNAISLYKRNYVPALWVLNDAYRLALKFGFYSLMTAPRFTHFRMMALGIVHGILGRTGRINET